MFMCHVCCLNSDVAAGEHVGAECRGIDGECAQCCQNEKDLPLLPRVKSEWYTWTVMGIIAQHRVAFEHPNMNGDTDNWRASCCLLTCFNPFLFNSCLTPNPMNQWYTQPPMLWGAISKKRKIERERKKLFLIKGSQNLDQLSWAPPSPAYLTTPCTTLS